MKIFIARGSPNRRGSSALLSQEFARGAREAGHEIIDIDVAHANIRPCLGCVRCGYEGRCIQHDDMDEIRKTLLESDMLVLVTPLYYYGMSAQLKIFIDRFCSRNLSISSRNLKSALICAAWNSDDWTFEALSAHYRTLVRYLNFNDQGMILGAGCGTLQMTKESIFMQKAYKLGLLLKD